MGFFFQTPTPTVAAEAKGRAKPVAKSKEAKRVTEGARGCDACPLKETWPALVTPRMPYSGRKDADVLVLGEAPGENEDLKGQPFIGTAGKLLRGVMPSRDMDRVAFQNTVRCRPKDNRNPTAQEAYACGQFLEEDIESLPIKAILGVGSVPLQRFWPGQTILRVHGQKFPVRIGSKTVWYFPTLHPSYVARMGGDRGPVYAAFRADVRRFFAEMDKWGTPKVHTIDPGTVILPTNEADAKGLLAKMVGARGFDIESNSELEPYSPGARLITAGFSDGNTTIAFPVDHPESPNNWGMRVMMDAVCEREWIAHNAAMELVWIRHFGPERQFAQHHDSQAITRIDYERETMGGLDEVSHIELGINVKSLSNINTKKMMDYSLAEILPYNGIDALASRLAFDSATKRTPATNPNYLRILDSISSTSTMQLLGLPTNIDMAKQLQAQWGGKAEAIAISARRIYEVKQWEAARQETFNIASNDHVGQALSIYGKLALPSKTTATGKTTYTTDDAALSDAVAKLEDKSHPLVTAVLDYREAAKLVSTYIQPVLDGPKRYGADIIHPKYSTMLTATLRLSSNDPNAQNYPKRTNRELRRQIKPPKNHLIYAFDYGQQEARILAMASKDRKFIEALLTGFDIHSYWRDIILEQYPEYIWRLAKMSGLDLSDHKAVLEGGRTIIKTDFVFASFYGAMAESVSARTGIPLRIVVQVLARFWNEYPGVKTWIKAQRQQYTDYGYCKTLMGVTRRGIMSGNETINTPIQGTAGQITLEAQNAMHKISLDLKEPALTPRINIHDDITFFLPDSDDVDDYINLIAETMMEVRHPWIVVPWMIEASVGENWCDLEKFAVFTGQYVR